MSMNVKLPPPLAQYTTEELLDELVRRSIGGVWVGVRMEENRVLPEKWQWRTKGSPYLTKAALAFVLDKLLAQDRETMKHQDWGRTSPWEV